MTTAAVIGCTGLVGAHILTALAGVASVSRVAAIARRDPKSSAEKQDNISAADSSTWPAKLAEVQPSPEMFLSALGTTKAAAGSLANQRKIDLDLNLDMAKAAKSTGVKVYVLVSSIGASASSSSGYLQMKGQLEEEIKQLGFEHAVILRPGLLVGPRDESRAAEGILHGLANLSGYVGLKDSWAQDADVVARAAVHAGLKCLEGNAPSQIWELTQKDILQLGRETWPPAA